MRTRHEVTIASTRVGLERAMRAVILTGSQVLGSFRLCEDLGRGVSVFLHVSIPLGELGRFREIAQPEDVRQVAAVAVDGGGEG